jgi:hypothetical protein
MKIHFGVNFQTIGSNITFKQANILDQKNTRRNYNYFKTIQTTKMGRPFTHIEDQFLIDNYLSMPAKTMAKQLGRSEGTARQRMKLLAIVVPPEIIEKYKIESRFKKGAVPFNKGKKMPADVYEKVKNTFFKKGQSPHNTKQKDGVITIRHDRHNRNNPKPYKYIRISLGKWQLYHQYRWEKFRGKVPPNHCLWFIDGNPMNCKLSNIECITRAENARRNKSQFDSYPKELKEVIKLNNKINNTLYVKHNSRSKEHTNRATAQA